MASNSTPLETDLIRNLKDVTDKLLFMSEVSRVLSAALTDSECLRRLLELVVPKIADWATLSVIHNEENIRRAAVFFRDPEKRPILESLMDLHPPG